MNERTPEQEAKRIKGALPGQSPLARDWAEWRRETRKAAAADRERARKEREDHTRRLEQEHPDPLIYAIGLVAILILLGATWFVIDAMRCDPFFVQIDRLHHTCE